MASVQLDDVCKTYDDVEAVKHLSLNCPSGTMMALLGPSGCGKSSTLKMIAGIEELSSGEIYFGDAPVSGLSPAARNIAMVFEDYALYPHRSVSQNIGFPLEIQGVGRRAIRQRVSGLLELLDLEAVADVSVKALSGGAQQRVSIGRALIRDPSLLLFDEPLSHLDGAHKVQLRSEIKRLQHTSALTSILVTHDQSEAFAMADWVAVMRDGELQQVDTADVIYSHPANLFVANFIGEPPMNMLGGELISEADQIWIVGGGWRLALNDWGSDLHHHRSDSRSLVVGIRPEHVRLRGPGDLAREEDRVDEARVEGRIRYIEPNADRDVVYIDLGSMAQDGEDLIAEIDGPSIWQVHDRCEACFDAANIHLFSNTNGINLRGMQRNGRS